MPLAATETAASTPLAAINDSSQATARPPAPQEQVARSKEQTPKKKADACELITKSEIKTVQGADVGETKGSERTSGPFILSQCYYTVVPFNKSVSLEVTRAGAETPATKAIEPFWQQRFREAKPTKGADVPQRVAGVGEDAYWVGNDLIGSLYVKQGDKIVRVSVGGKESIEDKRKKSVALARKALGRL